MIREMSTGDRETFCRFCDLFYQSDAVSHPVPPEYWRRTFDELLRSDQYLKGYLLCQGNEPAGYALLSRSFSPEAGGPVVWIEELYVEERFRGTGLGKEFFASLEERLAGHVCRLRLEAEPGNARAIAFYRSLGFRKLPYLQMVRDREAVE